MTSSAQLEQEAEQTRSELARTLVELRERFTHAVSRSSTRVCERQWGCGFCPVGRQTVKLPGGAIDVIRDQLNRLVSQGSTKLGIAFARRDRTSWRSAIVLVRLRDVPRSS